MGTGGSESTILSIRHENQCSIHFSMHSDFHPDMVEPHGRVIYCSAQDHAALCRYVLAILQALYAHGSPSETFTLFVVTPTANQNSLLGVGGQVLAQLKSKCQSSLFLRAPHVRPPFERLLVCTGSLEALRTLIPSLLSVFPQSLQYECQAARQLQDNVLDLPLNTAAVRYKQKEANHRSVLHSAKRSKTTTWESRRPGAG